MCILTRTSLLSDANLKILDKHNIQIGKWV